MVTSVPIHTQPFSASHGSSEATGSGLGPWAVALHTLHTTRGRTTHTGLEKQFLSFHRARLNTVKRRKTSSCKKKKQKCNPRPSLFLWGNKKLPDQVLSRVGGEESRQVSWEHFTIVQKEQKAIITPPGQTLLTLDDIMHVFPCVPFR